MKTFGTNDIIFARASVMGRELINLRLSGITSMEALLRCIKEALSDVIGLVNISIRNLTQGWNTRNVYRLA